MKNKYISSKRLKKLGKSTSPQTEIQNISNKGIWILVKDQEYYLPFTEFPWFLKATIAQIYNLELFHEKHLHWPELDIDLHLDAIKNPEAYPLKYIE